jgi:hypothetical protein
MRGESKLKELKRQVDLEWKGNLPCPWHLHSNTHAPPPWTPNKWSNWGEFIFGPCSRKLGVKTIPQWIFFLNPNLKIGFSNKRSILFNGNHKILVVKCSQISATSICNTWTIPRRKLLRSKILLSTVILLLLIIGVSLVFGLWTLV